MLERKHFDDLGQFVAAQYHPTAPDGRVQVLEVMDVAKQLTDYRDGCGLSQSHVAKAIGSSVSKIIRMEGGQALPSVPDVLTLLDIYGVTDDVEKQALRDRALANKSQRPSNPYRRLLEPMDAQYLEYEPAATDGIWLYETVIMPDFMQTSDYAARCDQVFWPNQDPTVAASLAQLRRERAAYLLGKHGPPLRIILSEEVLLRPEGGDIPETERYTQLQIMLEGVKALHTAARQLPEDSELNRDITIQVAPFSAGFYTLPFDQFSCNILNIPEHPSAVYTHRLSRRGIFTHDDPEKGDRYRRLFDQLAAHIPGPDETNGILDAKLDNLANGSPRGSV